MAGSVRVTMTVNGAEKSAEVEPRLLLVHFLRETLGLTGTHVGCDTSNCGACTVHLNGEAVKSCTLLAVQADGAEVKTIEGMGQEGALHPLQEAFWEHHGLQCGYCTPGMIMSAADLLQRNSSPSEHEVREALAGNLCRCTGYHNIVKAVMAAAQSSGGESAAPPPPSEEGRAAGEAVARQGLGAGAPARTRPPRSGWVSRSSARRTRGSSWAAPATSMTSMSPGSCGRRSCARPRRTRGSSRSTPRPPRPSPACTPCSWAPTSTSRPRFRWPGSRRGSRSTTRRTGRSP